MLKRKAVAFAVSLLVTGGAVSAMAADISAINITDAKQVAELTAEYWQDDFFGEIVVSPKTRTAEQDGKSISLKSKLSLSDFTNPSEYAENITEQENGLVAVVDENDDIHITAPFQTARLIVYADSLKSSFGAKKVLRDAAHGVYYLQYTTAEKAKNACEKFRAQLGHEYCQPDRVFTQAMTSIDAEEVQNIDIDDSYTAQTLEKPACISWGNSYLGLDRLKNEILRASLSNRKVNVAVVDTGINRHEIFDNHFFGGRSFVGRKISDKTFSQKTYTDYYGHGTHVAGIIADGTDGDVGIMGLRVFDKKGVTVFSAIQNALIYAADHKVDIINMSLQDKEESSDLWNVVLKKLHKKGITVVAAAGNGFGERVAYPARLSTAIAVSALDEDIVIGEYSNIGTEIDFAAPGTDVLSSSADGVSQYEFMTGTSMAAPHITAALAMIKHVYPDYTPSELKKELIKYCTDLGDNGKDSEYGYGVPRLSELYTEQIKNGNIEFSWDVCLKYKSMAYTGTARKNPIELISRYDPATDDYLIVGSENYTLTYENNVEVGTAKAVITGKGKYHGTIKIKFDIIPKPVSITKLSVLKSGGVKVRWNTVSKADGYQISYAGNKYMDNSKSVKIKGKSSYNISGLSKKHRYYFKIRSYKKVGSKTYWGRWSEISSIKL